jgi:hypothetical protein
MASLWIRTGLGMGGTMRTYASGAGLVLSLTLVACQASTPAKLYP